MPGQMASILEKAQNPNEAATYYGKIASGFPFSKHFDQAKERLAALKKPLPAVDEDAAAENKPHIKSPKSFSPWTPFVKIGKTFGFIGHPDKCEEAKKLTKDQKIKAAEAAGIIGGENGQEGDSAGINAVIRKSADSNTEVFTFLGAHHENSQPDITKKKAPNRNKRQGNKSRLR